MAHIDIKQAAGFLFAGATIGAAIALVYAPQSGIQTRKDMRRFARKSGRHLADLQSHLHNQVSDGVDAIMEVVKDGVDRGKKLSAEGYEQVLQGFNNAKNCVEEGRNRFEQLIKTS
jgi:gas vesicle protein